MPNGTYQTGENVQVKSPKTGHWVKAVVKAEHEDGYAVEFGNPKVTQIMPLAKIRVPQAKKRYGKELNKRKAKPEAQAVPATAVAHFATTPVHTDGTVDTPVPESQQEPIYRPHYQKPSPEDKANAALTELDEALEAARRRREAVDNEIAAMSVRRNEITAYLKVHKEFS